MTTEPQKTLTESINELRSETFRDTPCGIRSEIYLDPEAWRVYSFEHFGDSQPIQAFEGKHIHVCTILGHAVAASVADELLRHHTLLSNVCREAGEDLSDPDDYDASATCELVLADFEFHHHWHPEQWFEPATREIELMADKGLPASEIVLLIGLDYDGYQVVDTDAAVEWVEQYVATYRGEAQS